MPIPALIVSGYLGSGKTTLVGHLLDEARQSGTRLAIVSNEFGDTGIDRALLDSGEEGYVELDGGCVCCRLSDALGETLEMVIERAKPDRLVLETSGVALPGEVLLAFWRPPVEGLVSEVSIVVLVDAERVANRDTDETFWEQVEAADLVLLNKCDLVSPDVQHAAEIRLREASGGQPVLRTVRSVVPPDLLFPRRERGPSEAHAHTHEQFDSFELRFPGVVTEEEVLARIDAEGALRAKGFIRTADGVRVVQGVGPRVEVVEPRVPAPEGLVGLVVVIKKVGGG